MKEDFFYEIEANLTDRLGRIYNCDNEYKRKLEMETELIERLKENLTLEQFKIFEEYHSTAAAIWNTCGILSYRQGMRDFASILGINEQKD